MATLIEQLEHDIPRAEERLGFDARIVREMRRQLIGLKAEQTMRNQLVFVVSTVNPGRAPHPPKLTNRGA